jgi:hypothetical protein
MRRLGLLCVTNLLACAVVNEPTTSAPDAPADVGSDTSDVPDIRCAGIPDAGAPSGWRHTASHLVAGLGDAHHRGIDLIAADDDASQLLAGKVTYGTIDKDLEDEDIELFACMHGQWQPLGTARTDDDGRFSFALTGTERLPAGMRDLYLSVAGDRSGAAFVAFVAPRGTRVVVADVDGTLTASENAYPTALAIGGDVAAQPDAAAALTSLAARGYTVVYVTARGDRFTQDTRDWLAASGFPRGPMRLAAPIITLPGDDTVAFKSEAIASLSAFELAGGFGNRASDVAAYSGAGLPADRIFIKLPEFADEVAGALSAGTITGFAQYEQLRIEQLADL